MDGVNVSVVWSLSRRCPGRYVDKCTWLSVGGVVFNDFGVSHAIGPSGDGSVIGGQVMRVAYVQCAVVAQERRK